MAATAVGRDTPGPVGSGVFAPWRSCPDRPGVDPDNYRTRHFARVCERARLGKRKPKDLRDTFASQLLTCGVQLAYISEQLGHANTDVTAKAYAKWCGAGYRGRQELRRGEVPADLLARLSPGAPPAESGAR